MRTVTYDVYHFYDNEANRGQGAVFGEPFRRITLCDNDDKEVVDYIISCCYNEPGRVIPGGIKVIRIVEE